ncbi:hypothetical protein ZTR_10496 [Talaromyces verruculosus]|nr:hypothetical protein ZTR_10496 [Talaromyces verruculosus]
MEHTANMDPTDLSSTSGEEPGFCIPADLLWRQDPSRAVVTWTPDSFSPPISLVLDLWLRESVVQSEAQMPAYVPDEDGTYHSHDLLARLKRILGPTQGPDVKAIAEVIADVTSSVRAFYHLLNTSRLLRRHVPAYDKTFLETLLSLALYRPVYFWSPQETQPWQPWTLIDYAITADQTTAILTLTKDTMLWRYVYNLQNSANDCTMAFEPY